MSMQDEDLLVFGYASRIYSPDDRSDFIAEEQHLIVSPNDTSLRIDRYDCRLLLPVDYDVCAPSIVEESCPTEDLEEEMCDEERYRDMLLDTQQTQDEEETRPKKAEIAFDYKTNDSKINGGTGDVESDGSDSEAEPFEPPPGIKLPLGLAVPDNQKQNHIIERTALFVVTKGPQMEIVIKAKQRNNTEQFGFLEFDNVLHPYYKYLSKLIREKKYTPDLSKGAKRAPQREQTEDSTTGAGSSVKESKTNALMALANERDSDSDSDSDCELHPSLLSGIQRRGRSPDVMDSAENAAGPRRRPASPSPPPVTSHRHDYDMNKSNDIYASLFKSLSQVSVEREEAEKRQKEKLEIQKHIMASAPPPPDEEYRAWWLSFYGSPCPYSSPQPMVPPPPDLQPVISSYAEFVARHGVEAELDLRERADLQLNFMHPTNPHFSYYQHRVRMVQWELAQKASEEPQKSDIAETETRATPIVENLNVDGFVDDSSIPGTSSTLTCEQELAVPVLNRKQRRRLQDGFQVATSQPIGIVDPVATISLTDMLAIPKASSSPALLSSTLTGNPSAEEIVSEDSCSTSTGVTALQRPFPSVPVSFTLAPIRDENSSLSSKLVTADESSSSILVDPRTLSPLSLPQQTSITASQVHILPPPVPPNILSNTQLDRKEKARIFMERLLNEKRVKKLREQEEARIRELEAQKAEIERQLAEEDAKRKKTSLAMVDKLINSRIGALLGQMNTETSEVKTKLPARLSDDEADKDRDEMRKKRKKEKPKKHKHRKSRSRSRSRDRDRRRRRRSSDSRSSDRDSRRRKKERR